MYETASNGTNSEADRDAIQAEIEQLTTEIDRVAETTKFNETYLLKGNTTGQSSTVKVVAHDAGLAGKDYSIGTSGKGTVLDKDTLNTSTEGYVISTADPFDVTTKLAVGDSVTQDGNTYTNSVPM